MTFYVYRAEFFTGYATIAQRLSATSAEEAENRAMEIAQEEGWSFTWKLDLEQTIDLEALCRR